MMSQKYGRIINFSSGLAFKGKFGAAHYAAAKGGIVSFGKSLAQEVASFGVTVNAIAPGIVDTEMSRSGLPKEEIRAVETNCPMGRIAVPEDLTEAVIFLASEGSRFITGQCIHINGGFLMP
jgi:3-oxoacyl-[acyl-carrier protein] reductase